METNIVFCELTPEAGMTPQVLVDKLLQEGIRLGARKRRIRAVTHLAISRQDIEDTLEVMHTLLH